MKFNLFNKRESELVPDPVASAFLTVEAFVFNLPSQSTSPGYGPDIIIIRFNIGKIFEMIFLRFDLASSSLFEVFLPGLVTFHPMRSISVAVRYISLIPVFFRYAPTLFWTV
jgi:hypothetical protein